MPGSRAVIHVRSILLLGWPGVTGVKGAEGECPRDRSHFLLRLPEYGRPPLPRATVMTGRCNSGQRGQMTFQEDGAMSLEVAIAAHRLGISPDVLRRRLLSLRRVTFDPRYPRRSRQEALRRLTAPVPTPLREFPVLKPGVVLRGWVTRIERDHTVHVQIGPLTGILPTDARIPTRYPSGRLVRGMAVWVAITDVDYTPDGPRITVSQIDPAIPAAVLMRIAGIPELICRTIMRQPGVASVVAVSARGVKDPVKLAVGPGGKHVRLAERLLGEQIRVVQEATA